MSPYSGQIGHISRECDLHHDICHMMLDEQDNFIQHVMANCDTAMAAAAELMTQIVRATLLT
jgi:enamine deaminase RidA (YjgF/YER057c/UK114 family)